MVKKIFLDARIRAPNTNLLGIKPSGCILLLYLARRKYCIYQTWKIVKPKTLIIAQYGKDRIFFTWYVHKSCSNILYSSFSVKARPT